MLHHSRGLSQMEKAGESLLKKSTNPWVLPTGTGNSGSDVQESLLICWVPLHPSQPTAPQRLLMSSLPQKHHPGVGGEWMGSQM